MRGASGAGQQGYFAAVSDRGSRSRFLARFVNRQTVVVREYRAAGDFDELERSDALDPAIAAGDPQKDGPAAIESPMPPARKLPQTVQISAHDGIVRAAQSAIGADSEVGGANHHARFVPHRRKSECDQFSSSTVTPSSASMISPSVVADSVKPVRRR